MENLPRLLSDLADYIGRHQLPSGAIPWYEEGITDPWDHVECAIALDLTGRFDRAVTAYRWLAGMQNPDGSWYSAYIGDQPKDRTRDTNQSSYFATGVWYHFLVTRDEGFLREMWPSVEAAIDFALRLQQPGGEVLWACNGGKGPWPGAIYAASTCVWQSVRSGLRIAGQLEVGKPDWESACARLLDAMRERRHSFDRFGEDSQGFATNWYYPVLTGVLKGQEARKVIDEKWQDFVVEDWGCKCVTGTPWVTVAETSELVMSLYRIGDRERAGRLVKWMLRLKDHDGGFETGVKLPDQMIWPEEKNTWTSAGVIMAIAAWAKAEGLDIEGLHVP